MLNVGFIDYYLDEWHANNYPAWIERASAGQMRVTHAYALIDSPKGGRGTARWCGEMGITPCDTIEGVIDACDALIVLSPDDVQMHEQLCQLPLLSGKPTYVDKTFAPDLAAAKRIFAIAEKGGTPCYSTSALRYADGYSGAAAQEILAVNSWGPGTFDTYAIHQLEPLVMVMGASASRVMALSARGWATLVIAFDNGRQATVSCFEEGGPFEMNLCIPGGNRIIRADGDYFAPFIQELVAFFHDGRVRVAHEDTLRIMALRGAGVEALARPGTWVEVPQV